MWCSSDGRNNGDDVRCEEERTRRRQWWQEGSSQSSRRRRRRKFFSSQKQQQLVVLFGMSSPQSSTVHFSRAICATFATAAYLNSTRKRCTARWRTLSARNCTRSNCRTTEKIAIIFLRRIKPRGEPKYRRLRVWETTKTPWMENLVLTLVDDDEDGQPGEKLRERESVETLWATLKTFATNLGVFISTNIVTHKHDRKQLLFGREWHFQVLNDIFKFWTNLTHYKRAILLTNYSHSITHTEWNQFCWTDF